jgi:hypothetical protein
VVFAMDTDGALFKLSFLKHIEKALETLEGFTYVSMFHHMTIFPTRLRSLSGQILSHKPEHKRSDYTYVCLYEDFVCHVPC